MVKLRLPIIKGHIPNSRPLSMDDYLRFVRFNLKYTSNRRANKTWKKALAVDVPFSLK